MKQSVQTKLRLSILMALLMMPILSVNSTAQIEPYEQTDLTISSVLLPETVNQGEEFGSQTRVTIYNQGTTIIEGGYYLELVISSDREAPIQSAQPTTTFVEDGLLPNGRITMPTMEPESTLTFTFPGVTMVIDAPLDELVFICAVIDPEDVIDERWRGYHDGYGVNKLCMPIDVIGGSSTQTPTDPPADEPDPAARATRHRPDRLDATVAAGEEALPAGARIPTREPPSEAPPSDSQPPTRTISDNNRLADYDSDSDCRLSDSEFFNVVDDWTSETASNSIFFSAIDAWMGQREICPSGDSQGLWMEMTLQGLVIESVGKNTLTRIEIFDLNGNLISGLSSQSQRLFWNLRDTQGELVANGVYLVRRAETGELRKFVVMR